MDIITMKPEDFEDATVEQLHECSENFLQRFKNKYRVAPDNSAGKQELSKIMLDLTDDCNLDCGYCYAAKYYDKTKMPETVMDKIIAKFFLSGRVSGVRQVIFFGGEPMLHAAGMEYFIDRINGLFQKKNLANLPFFSIITNGTIYSRKISELFKKHHMGVLVSCDGPPEIQNQQRPFRKSGRGSYDIVARNIGKMMADGHKVSIECTVSKRAIEMGYNHARLRAFFHEEFGIDRIIFIPEMITGKEELSSIYRAFYNHENLFIRALLNLDFKDEMFDTPYRLLMKTPLVSACGLGSSLFHILANGDIYPCQIVAGMEEYKIADIDTFNDSHFQNNSWIGRYKENSKRCFSCWAKPLCKFCPTRLLLESNSYILPESACVERRKLLEELILEVVRMRKDKNQWSHFMQRLEQKPVSFRESIN